MIFVTVGTERFPFNRLVMEVDLLKEEGVLEEEVFVQLGSCTYEPKKCKWVRFLKFDEMRTTIENSRIIIAHAGAGTALLCLQLGKYPILVPRQRRYAEHVDDHQVTFARIFEQLSRAIIAYEITDLRRCLRNAQNGAVPVGRWMPENSALVTYLNSLMMDF